MHVTKKEVIMYYIRMAPRMLPFLSDRAVTMHRFPGGIGGEDFYEKDAPQGTPEFVNIFTHYSETADREVNFVVCNNLDTLIWLANLASLELHITLSKTGSYESPDLLFFDIDPEPPLGFDDVIDVSLIVRKRLEDAGLVAFAKTSGKKGLHIVVPLQYRSPVRGSQGICAPYRERHRKRYLPGGLRISPVPGSGDHFHRLSPERQG